MNKVTIYLFLYVIMLVLLGLYSKNIRADMYDMYYEEVVEYIVAYGKPLPEMTTFSCKNGKLKKGYHPVRNMNGVQVDCKLTKMTRREYEDLDVISRVF